MSPLRTPLCLLSFAFLLCRAVGIDPLFNICSSSGNTTSNDLFGKNLDQLMFILTTSTPPIGFGLGSVGKGESQVNGLALCRGDVNTSSCTTCVQTAAAQIHHLCPLDKEAIIWFDNCLLHYSHEEFFGEIDDKHEFYMWNTQNVSDPSTFNAKVADLMNQLTSRAYLTQLLFATGDMELGGCEKLYGLVQCTKDLSGGDCKKCLETAIDQLPSFSNGKGGGRVVGGSCNIRYELYPFYDA